MQANAFNRNEDPAETSTVARTEDQSESLKEMTPAELMLMQQITLHQMHEAQARGGEFLVLGRVWYRLEQERRRRSADVAALERMYFAR